MKRLRRKFGVVLAVFGVIATFVLSIAVASSPVQALTVSCTAWNVGNNSATCTFTFEASDVDTDDIASGSYSGTVGRFAFSGTVAKDGTSVQQKMTHYGAGTIRFILTQDDSSEVVITKTFTVAGPAGAGDGVAASSIDGTRPSDALAHIRDYSLENAPVVIGIIGAIFLLAFTFMLIKRGFARGAQSMSV